MNTIFARGPSLLSRLILSAVLSVTLMVLDHKLDSFSSARVFLNSLVSPLQYVANMPGEVLSEASRALTTRQQLLNENARLTQSNMLMSEQLQRLQMLQRENDKLRRLLGSEVREDVRKMVAELMAVDNNPYSHQIVINKGALDGVYEGQPVLDDKGVVGQVTQVGSTNSRVLLIADVTHGVPVQVMRNGVRSVVSGSGQLHSMMLNHVPHSTDIRQGDLLVSSGLGDVFPEGYPVATVKQVLRDESRPFAHIEVEPVAELDRLKYLLLLWPAEAPEEPVMEDNNG